MKRQTMTAKRKADLAPTTKGHHPHYPHPDTLSPYVLARLGFLVVFVVCSFKIIFLNVNISVSQKVAGETSTSSLTLVSIGNKNLAIDDPEQLYLRGSIKWRGSERKTPKIPSGAVILKGHPKDAEEKIDADAPQIDVEEIAPIDADEPQIEVVKKEIDQDAPVVEEPAPNMAPTKKQVTETEEQTKSAPTILIVVTTNRLMLPIRVAALLKAWAGNVPANILVRFFVGTDVPNGKLGSKKDIRALALKAGLEESSLLHVLDVKDNEYPPVYKNTAMLQRADKIVTDFREAGNGQIDWIFKVDDDTYVNLEKLPVFLESKDPTQHRFYGSQGSGRVDDREGLKNAGLLKPYCMGGPGFILSHTALHATAPTFQECVKEYDESPWREQIWHSDSIIGLCVQKQTGLGCWDDATKRDNHGRKAFRHIAVGADLDALILKQKRRMAAQSISIHPIKEPSTMAALHIMISGSDVAAPTEESSRTDSLSRTESLPLSVADQTSSFAEDDDIIPTVLKLAAKKYPKKFKDRIKRIRKWHEIGAEKVVNKMITKSIQEIKDMDLEGG